MTRLQRAAAGGVLLALVATAAAVLSACPKIPDDPIFADWDAKPRMLCEGERTVFEYFITPNAVGQIDGLRILPNVGVLDLNATQKAHTPRQTETYTIEALYKGKWYSTPLIPSITVEVFRDCDALADLDSCPRERASTPGKSTGDSGPNEPPCEWIVEYPPGSTSKSLRVAAIQNPNPFPIYVRKAPTGSGVTGQLWSPVEPGATWKLVSRDADESVPLGGTWRLGPADGETDPRFLAEVQSQGRTNCIGTTLDVVFVLTCGARGGG